MATYFKKEISEWTTSDLCGWLLDNKFRGISELFQKNSISGYDLFFINDDILKTELGLSSFHERKLAMKLITKLTNEHLKLNVINSNGDNVIITLDNNHETSLGELANYIGNMFNIDSNNILFKDSTKQEVLSPTIKIVKFLILYPKIYKTLNISNMKDYHQMDEELQGSAVNNTRFNSIGSLEQSMNDKEVNKNFEKNNIRKNDIYNIEENQKNNFIENNYNFKYNSKNFKTHNNENNFLINSGASDLVKNDEMINLNNERLNVKTNNNTNVTTAEAPYNENRERIYKSEKRVYRATNEFNQKQIKQNMEENYNDMAYDDNELSMSSGNEEEIKFKPSYQIKKSNNNMNVNREGYYNYYQNNNTQKNIEQRNRGDFMSNKNMESKNFYKNKVFNEDFENPNYNNKIIKN